MVIIKTQKDNLNKKQKSSTSLSSTISLCAEIPTALEVYTPASKCEQKYVL